MCRILPAALLVVLCSLVTGLVPLAGAEEEAPALAEDAELETAVAARRESREFARKADAVRQAREAEQEAIAAIPEVQAIDAELESLRLRIQELLTLRRQAIQRHVATLDSYRSEVERAKEDLRASDPVRQVLGQRRAELAAELAATAP